MVGIYSITNKINGKKYIGQSVDIERRWQQHRSAAFDVRHSLYYCPFYTDIRYYGLDNFEFKIEEIVAPEQLNAKELYYMKKYNTLQTGYNIVASSGQKICLENIETREKFFFSSFESCENWLHQQQITTGKKLKAFLKQNIKTKQIIYNKFLIYYWRD